MCIRDRYPGEDALMARVEWTPKGREYIANKEYRYLSPVVLVKKADQMCIRDSPFPFVDSRPGNQVINRDVL